MEDGKDDSSQENSAKESSDRVFDHHCDAGKGEFSFGLNKRRNIKGRGVSNMREREREREREPWEFFGQDCSRDSSPQRPAHPPKV